MLYVLKIRYFFYSIFIIGLYLVVSVISNHFFLTETYFSQWYEGILSQKQVHDVLAFAKKWEWGIFLINILLIFIKISCVSVCLYLGLFFFSNHKNAFNIVFNVALKAEFVFVAYSFVRLLWYILVHKPESFEELQVMPLSLMHFFDPITIEPWLIFPLNTLNIFEILYVLMLSALMAKAIQVKFRKAFDLVFVSYGSGLLLLIVVQMFLILNNA